MRKTRLAVFFLAQFLVYFAFARDANGLDVSDGKQDMEFTNQQTNDAGEDSSDTTAIVQKAKEEISNQRNQLTVQPMPPAEAAPESEEENEARQEAYEQKIIQEVEMRQPSTILEARLERERYRRDLMARAGREITPPFKLRKAFGLKLSETYDDNIYLTDSNEKEDYITRVSPSILFSLSSKYICLDANYVMDITQYKNNHSQSGVSHLISSYIKPGSLYLPFFRKRGGKIGIEFQDDLKPFATSVASSEQTQRTDSTYNKSILNIDYYMSAKRTLSLGYINIYQDYRTASLKTSSYTENVVSPTFYFHTTPKWSLFAEYDYGWIDYMKGGSNSSRQHSLKAGLTGRILKKVITHMEAGEEWRYYKKGSGNSNIHKPLFNISFLNNFTPSTKASLEYNHSIEESIYSSNAYFISDSIDFDLNTSLTYKTSCSFGVEYTYNTYDNATTEDSVTKKRRDGLWEPYVGLTYHFRKWISADARYVYRKKSSNFSKFDYADKRIEGSLNLLF